MFTSTFVSYPSSLSCSTLPSLSLTLIHTRVFCFQSTVATLTDPCCELPVSHNPEHSDTFTMAPKCHSRDDSRTFSATMYALAVKNLPQICLVAAPYPPPGWSHPPLSTSASIVPDATTPHKHLHPYLVVTRPSDVRESCSVVVWDKRRRADTGTRGGSVPQTAAGFLPRLVPRPGSNLNYRASLSSGFRKIAIPCRIVVYLLRRCFLVEAMPFDTISMEVDPSIRSSVVQERALLDHWLLCFGK